METKTNFQSRLRECLQVATGGAQAPLAKFIAERHGIALQSARSRVSNWLTNERAPSPLAEMVGTVADFLALNGVRVRAEWLASGTGEREPHDLAADAVKIHAARRFAPILDSASMRELAAALHNLPEARTLVEQLTKKNKGLAVYSDVSETTIAFQVSGDAMTPTLQAGDVVLVDWEAELASGKLVLLEHQGAILVRRLQNEGGAGWLVADNVRYPAVPAQDARIIGRVIEMTRRDL